MAENTWFFPGILGLSHLRFSPSEPLKSYDPLKGKDRFCSVNLRYSIRIVKYDSRHVFSMIFS